MLEFGRMVLHHEHGVGIGVMLVLVTHMNVGITQRCIYAVAEQLGGIGVDKIAYVALVAALYRAIEQNIGVRSYVEQAVHVLLVAYSGVAHHLEVAHSGGEHKVGGSVARAVETETDKIVGKIEGMHARTIVVSQILSHPQVAESFEGVGTLIEDDIAIDAVYAETLHGTHHAIHKIRHLGKMA